LQELGERKRDLYTQSSFPALEAYLRFRIIRFHFLNSLARSKAAGKNLNEEHAPPFSRFKRESKHFPVHLVMHFSFPQSLRSFCRLALRIPRRARVCALFMNCVVARVRLQFFVRGIGAENSRREKEESLQIKDEICI